MRVYNFGGSGHILTKFYQRMWLIAGVIKWNLFYKGCPYKISQISHEWIDISKIRQVLDQLHFIPYWAKKFGELWSTNNTRMLTHPTGLVRKTIFRRVGSAGPSNFYTR